MVIGFTERTLTVSESMAPPGYDIFSIDIPVATLRRAERAHQMTFRLQQLESTAIVEPGDDLTNPLFDAIFGTRARPDDYIDLVYDLRPLEYNIPSLLLEIRNDFTPENEECLKIRVLPIDIEGQREQFSCNEDDSFATYFCQITVCIEDDDGKFTS